MMTVQELIDELSQLNPDEELLINFGGIFAGVNDIGEVKMESGTYITIEV